jgi:hypothetical protein
VIFELPGIHHRIRGTAQDSLDALRKATDTAYYKGNGSLGSSSSPLVTSLAPRPHPASGGASLQASK